MSAIREYLTRFVGKPENRNRYAPTNREKLIATPSVLLRMYRTLGDCQKYRNNSAAQKRSTVTFMP